MKYEISGWVETALNATVEADNKEEAIRKFKDQECEIHEGPWGGELNIDKVEKIFKNGRKQLVRIE